MDIDKIRSGALSMAGHVYEMLELIEKGFIENRKEFLTDALKKEDEINRSERSLTEKILELSKTAGSAKEKKEFVQIHQIVEMFERMGDEAASLVERIEIKVAENLLFSDEGVEQFVGTYGAMKKSVEMMCQFLKNKDANLKERVIDNGFHVKSLVERYRQEHADRLVKGLCSPIAANMYFDMLDFTGNLARHSSNIVKLL